MDFNSFEIYKKSSREESFLQKFLQKADEVKERINTENQSNFTFSNILKTETNKANGYANEDQKQETNQDCRFLHNFSNKHFIDLTHKADTLVRFTLILEFGSKENHKN